MDFTPVPQTIMVLVHLPDIGSGRDQLFLPACATAISASILLLHAVFALKPVNGFLARVGILEDPKNRVPPPGIGNGVILRFRVARLLGCLGLLALSIFSFVHEHEDLRREGLVRGMVLSVPYVSFLVPIRHTLTLDQLYASVLAFFSLSPKNARHRLIRHANCVLFLAFCVYVYRDLFPLATFTGVPADLAQGRQLWAKIALLFITAVIIPLFTPRQYIPVDPLVSFRKSLLQNGC
jgi:hypothetical protein